MRVIPRQVLVFQTRGGQIPFEAWLCSLRDGVAKARILSRLGRVRLGNLGDFRSVGDGVSELRIDCGPGYRLYFGMKGETLVVLLCAGDKSTQDKDIHQAKEYWRDYKEREK
jgi:putative addiction module killer protein